MLDMPRVREVFQASSDFTVGLEEEFAILDPRTLALAQRFEELRAPAQDDPVLAESVAGELIKSEIENRELLLEPDREVARGLEDLPDPRHVQHG